MGCCGKTRTASLTDRHRIRVRYLGGRPVVIKGTVTGTSYHFAGTERVKLVDPRDAVSITKNQLFRIEGIAELSPA